MIFGLQIKVMAKISITLQRENEVTSENLRTTTDLGLSKGTHNLSPDAVPSADRPSRALPGGTLVV